MLIRRFASLSILIPPLALALGYAAPAHAQWFVRANGPDVFGNTTVLASADANDRSGDAIVVQCDQDNLYIALISAATPSEIDQLSKLQAGMPATLYLKVDQQPVQKFDADLRQWNDTMAGVVASGRTPAMLAELRAIGAGTESLDVGFDIFGNRQSDSFSLSGSTNAMDTAIKDCKLDSAATPSGQAPPATLKEP